MKTCSRCGETKSKDEFHKRGGGADNLHSACGDCRNIYRKKYYRKNSRRERELARQYRQTYVDEGHKARSHRHYEANKVAYMDRDVRRRQSEREVAGTLTDANIKTLFEMYPNCLKCGSTDNLSIDHIVPISRGGSNYFSNLQVLCRSCNSGKGNHHSTDYRPSGRSEIRTQSAKDATLPIFHSRPTRYLKSAGSGCNRSPSL